MNASRFDQLAVLLSGRTPRRSLLRALLGVALATRLRGTTPARAAAPVPTACRLLEATLPDKRPVLQPPFRAVGKDETAPCGRPVNPGVVPYVTTRYGGYWTHEDSYFNEHFAVDFGTGGKSFPVLAAATGTLRRHDDSAGAGLYIRHNPSWQTKYLHLDPECGLITHPKTGKPVSSADPAFEVEAGTLLGWTLYPLDEGTHLHFALRGGATGNFTSFASPDCCPNKNCNWSYPIPEIVPDLPVPELAFTACAKEGVCDAIEDRLARAAACCAPAIVPGGMWVSAGIENDMLRLVARAYPTSEGDPAIERVAFTLWWPEYGPRKGPWDVGCTDFVANARGEYACELDLTTTGAPHGEITVSFDVYDVDGNHNLAPNGTKTLQWTDSGCAKDEIRCDGACVNKLTSGQHCGRCHNDCGLFRICCDGTCGCDGTVIIPGYCLGSAVICYPS